MKKLTIILLIIIITIGLNIKYVNAVSICGEGIEEIPAGYVDSVSGKPYKFYFLRKNSSGTNISMVIYHSANPFITAINYTYPTYISAYVSMEETISKQTYTFETSTWESMSTQSRTTIQSVCSADTVATDEWYMWANYAFGGYYSYNPIEPNPWDYYINDEGSLFEESEINEILELEKKFEKNLGIQFFITTKESDDFNTSHFGDIIDYGNTKSPTKNGAFVIDIDHNITDDSYKIIVIENSYSSIQEPAIGIINSIKKYMKKSNDFNIDNLEKAINSIYMNFGLQDSYEIDRFGHYDWVAGTTGYSLVNDKLTVTSDYTEYGFTQDEASMLLFADVAATPRPSQPPEPTPVPTPTPIPEGEDPGESEGIGLLGGIWNLLKVIFNLLLAVLGLIFKALTLNVNIKGVDGGSTSLLTEKMIQGIVFLKSIEIPMFNMTIWQVFELVFTSVLTFILFKIIQRKIIRPMAGGGM